MQARGGRKKRGGHSVVCRDSIMVLLVIFNLNDLCKLPQQGFGSIKEQQSRLQGGTHPEPHASISSCTFQAAHAQVPLAAPHVKCVQAGLRFPNGGAVVLQARESFMAEMRKWHRLTFSSFILIISSYIVQII